MPNYTPEQLMRQVEVCHKGLDDLFLGLQVTPEFKRQIKAIKLFHIKALEHAIDVEDMYSFEEIFEQYQSLITTFSDVKSGDMSKEDALELIEQTTNKRLNQAIIHNILNVCQLLFWAAIGFGSYAACSMVGLPLLILEPWLGALMITSTALGYLTGVYQFVECCFDFQSSTPVYEENERCKDVISFFKPAVQVIVVNAQPDTNPPGLFYGDVPAVGAGPMGPL